MSPEPREQTQLAVGNKIIDAAETASGLSVVPPEEITIESRYSSGLLHQNQKWVYVEISDDPDFDAFYNSLPNTIQRLLSFFPYRDDVVLFRTDGLLFNDHRTIFNIPQSENIPRILSTIVDLCTYISKHTADSDTEIVETDVTQKDSHTILIPKQSTPTVGSNSERFLLNWLNKAGLVISKAQLTTIDSTVYYECTISERHSPNLVKFFGQVLQTLPPATCPSCDSQSIHVIESPTPDREEQDPTNLEYTYTLGCSSCLQYYEIPSSSVQTVFSTEQFEDLLNTVVNESTPTNSYSLDRIRSSFKESFTVNMLSFEDESTFIEFEDGEILYVFSEDEITVLLLYNNSLIDFDFNSTYDEDSRHRTDIPRPCRICGTYNSEIAFRLKRSVTTFHPDALFEQTYSSDFLGPSLCNSCVEDISTMVEEKLYEVKTEEEVLTEYI